MRSLSCTVIALTILVTAAVFCVASTQPSGYVTAQLSDDTTPTDESIATPSETPQPINNATDAEPTVFTDPTPTPTPCIDPGSPLSAGGTSFEETLAQFDIISLAEMVLVGLGVMWVIIILVAIVRRLDKDEKK
jgi:hypothetical protein